VTWQPATATPTVPGWYVVRADLRDRPLVLWWSRLSTQWREGARVVPATEWLGPL
jgi:hypothetical protein